MHHACTTDEVSTSFSTTDSIVEDGAMDMKEDCELELTSYDVQAVLRTRQIFISNSKQPMDWESSMAVDEIFDAKKPKDIIRKAVVSEIQPATDDDEPSVQTSTAKNEVSNVVPIKPTSCCSFFVLSLFILCSALALILLVVVFIIFDMYEFGFTSLVPIFVCGTPSIGILVWSTKQFLIAYRNNKRCGSCQSRENPLCAGGMVLNPLQNCSEK